MTPDLASALRRHFGHAGFRAGQEEIVRAVVEGRDVLAVMPTGSGKSIGYQLPAMLLPGTTLVVSPLIALMKDQVDDLNRRGVAAAALHSNLTTPERERATRMAGAGELRLLYVAPERFASRRFQELLARLPLARFAVDEAHCVSEWGHDFRPDYRALASAARRCRRADGGGGRPPVLAFTATATPEVREDIVQLLGLSDPAIFVAGFDRPNLFLDVRRVSGQIEKRALLPDLVGKRRALVYAATRRSAARAAAALAEAGVDAAAYHAGLDDAERSRVQDRFARGEVQVVCATNAFGMGIDRPDVEAVVHFEIPGSLEAYYQEIGRSGRDGRPARATLLWNYVDVRTREFLLERDAFDEDPRPGAVPVPAAERDRRRMLDRAKLGRMIAFADSTGCLRASLLTYFGERVAETRCGRCGNCSRRAPLSADEVLLLRKILSGIVRGGERWGRRKIAAMLAGRLEDLPESLRVLSTTGILSSEPVPRILDWIDAAKGGGLLAASEDAYRTLSLTREGREVMAGRTTQVELTRPQPPARRPSGGRRRRNAGAGGASAEADPALFATLKAWRREESRSRAVPAYRILHDRTLAALAAARPSTRDELSAVPGIGPSRLEAFGDALLALLASPDRSDP